MLPNLQECVVADASFNGMEQSMHSLTIVAIDFIGCSRGPVKHFAI